MCKAITAIILFAAISTACLAAACLGLICPMVKLIDGTITGTPTQTGSFKFTVRVTDSE